MWHSGRLGEFGFAGQARQLLSPDGRASRQWRGTFLAHLWVRLPKRKRPAS
jgi:hypothetical protein